MKIFALIAAFLAAVIFTATASAKPGCWADNACKKHEAAPAPIVIKDRGYLWTCGPQYCRYDGKPWAPRDYGFFWND